MSYQCKFLSIYLLWGRRTLYRGVSHTCRQTSLQVGCKRRSLSHDRPHVHGNLKLTILYIVVSSTVEKMNHRAQELNSSHVMPNSSIPARGRPVYRAHSRLCHDLVFPCPSTGKRPLHGRWYAFTLHQLSPITQCGIWLSCPHSVGGLRPGDTTDLGLLLSLRSCSLMHKSE